MRWLARAKHPGVSRKLVIIAEYNDREDVMMRDMNGRSDQELAVVVTS